MPAISKIRFTNVIYENGNKRYNDDIFEFDGYNGAIVLENGGGKTVFVQTALQSILPHHDMSDRKIRETLSLEGDPCHIAIEWILNEKPRRYALTAVTLFLSNNKLSSYKYVYEYGHNDNHSIENLPFVEGSQNGKKRPASKGEINDYYSYMSQQHMDANTFRTIRDFHAYIEDNFKIIPSEWRNIAMINSAEGGVEAFFEDCKTTDQLVSKLLIPVVEEAITGDGTKDFVESFEKQRDRFKKHKQLRERIVESEKIQEQIDNYVNIFVDYHNQNKKLIDKKAEAKALYLFIKNEEENIFDEVNENIVEKEKIEGEQKELSSRKDSYKLALIRKDLDEVFSTYDINREEFNKVNEDYNSKSKQLINLKIAKIKNKIKESDENIKSYQRQLKRLQEDTDIDIKEIVEKLEENSAQIKGYFVREEEKLKKKINQRENQKNRYEDELENLKVKLEEIDTEGRKTKTKIDEKNGEIKVIKKDLQNILRKLNTPEQRDMKELQTKWRTKIGRLEGELAQNNQQIKELQNEETKISDDLKYKKKSLRQLEKEETSLNERIKSIDQKQAKLLIKAKEINSNWYYIDSLYTRQDSIINYIENRIENLKNEKEEILLKERIVKRFLDDYINSDYFAAEPLLEKLVSSWRSQLSYVESGTKYIQRVSKVKGNDIKEYFANYPFWTMSIVVSNNEVNKLKDKIDKEREKITYPILILSENEARNIVDGKILTEELVVFPKYWEDNIEQKVFENWKKELSSNADEITKERKFKESEIENISSVFKEFKTFFEENPYEKYKELKENYSKVKDNLYSLKEAITGMENRLKDIGTIIIELDQKSEEYSAEKNLLNNWVQLVHEYINKEKDKQNLSVSIYELREKLENNESKKKRFNKEINIKQSIVDDLLNEIRDFNGSLNLLRKDALYTDNEVINSVPSFTEISINGLETERKYLKDILNEKRGDIEEIKEKIDEENEKKKELETNLKQEREQNDYEIDEKLSFSSYGEGEIESLIKETKKLKRMVEKLQSDLTKSRYDYNKVKTEYDIREKDYYNEYNEIIEFTEPLFKIEIRLREDQEVLDKRYKKNGEILKKLEVERKKIQEAKDILDRKHERYRYLIETIQEGQLTEELKRDFPYNRIGFVNELIGELTNIDKYLEEAKEKVNVQKNKFVNFCNTEIKDPRLREKTISGVRQKNEYKGIVNWQKKMINNINRTIKIAQDDMRQHDKDLEQFIKHLFTHLDRLTTELRNIPKKTRIKVEDKWKEIFIFKVPEWKEQEGKEELRKHVDWMINQLENDEFKNDDGSNNDTNIRNKVEKWLQSKHLLKIVLKNNDIKVSCRKVTNDGKVSSAPTTWQNSNKWSGGEKWSKNMTLFLGILNYIAEKRQSIITSKKANRIVIVDNPFGKASSDHVLDPVFFVAEKLGFQIIALTAHTEGKFIRNYFPVVYSCRLRETTKGNSKIIDKEKEIHYAFFKDNDPMALSRLEEREQMSLFK